MENNILMISMYLICKWWHGVNQNVKVLFLLQDKDTQQFKLEQIWLSKADLTLINKLRKMQVLDKELNFNLAI